MVCLLRIKESEQIVAESHASVQRSLGLAENTKQLAADTLESLGRQGNKLKSIQETVDDIGELQDRADRHMRAINSIGKERVSLFLLS